MYPSLSILLLSAPPSVYCNLVLAIRIRRKKLQLPHRNCRQKASSTWPTKTSIFMARTLTIRLAARYVHNVGTGSGQRLTNSASRFTTTTKVLVSLWKRSMWARNGKGKRVQMDKASMTATMYATSFDQACIPSVAFLTISFILLCPHHSLGSLRDLEMQMLVLRLVLLL